MLKSEMRSFQACIYKFTGPTLLGPDNQYALWRIMNKQPGFVIAFDPMPKVDPRGWFAYVHDGTDTYCVSAKSLEPVEKVTIEWERKPYMTAYQEKAREIEAMRNCIINYTSDHHEAIIPVAVINDSHVQLRP